LLLWSLSSGKGSLLADRHHFAFALSSRCDDEAGVGVRRIRI
jgi:hypothetical protein